VKFTISPDECCEKDPQAPRQLKAPGDCDPELPVEAIREKEIKIKNPQWITSQVVFLSQVWRQTGSMGVMRPGAMEKAFSTKTKNKINFQRRFNQEENKSSTKKNYLIIICYTKNIKKSTQ